MSAQLAHLPTSNQWDESRLLPYQQKMVSHMVDHPNAMVWADMGLGKTVSALTAVVRLQEDFQVSSVLVVAPLRIIQSVWEQEARKWDHTRHLRFALLHGSESTRVARLSRPADIYLINYEMLAWLATQIQHRYLRHKRYPPFSMVIYDEVTKVKSSTSKRVKAWKKILPYLNRRVGLTGEPAANGYTDLFGQYLCVDGGQRLGTSVTAYREAFLQPFGYLGSKWVVTKTGRDAIHRRISDITVELAAEDYLDLPPVVNNLIWVDLPPKAREIYDTLEKDFFAELDSGAELEVVNEASKINKLIQVASGAAYLTVGGPWEEIHTVKMEALQDLVEEASGRPMLLGYNYVHEASRISQAFPERVQDHDGATFLSSKLGAAQVEAVLRRWGYDEIPLLCGHPACLHPWTEVLTETRGWRKIVDVLPWERVFDGIEFVSHSGCYLSGRKAVIEVFGVKMTPDHKLWVNGRWEEAASVRDRPGARAEALYQYQGYDQGLGEMLAMRSNGGIHPAERGEAQQDEKDSLRQLHREPVSSHDQHPDLEDLARHAQPLRGRSGPKLRGTWDRILQTVGKIRELLPRHAKGVLRYFDPRTNRCEWSLLQRKLPMGYSTRAAGKQAEQPLDYLPGRTDPSGRVLPTDRYEQRKADWLSQPRDDWGPSCRSGKSLDLQPRDAEKTPVYDLVNCGPRHRFVIRNAEGECFLSHNSMGHGLNLQHGSARAVIWFSLPWSLELYNQMNARLIGGHRRKGASVVHHILARNTVDDAIWEALKTKRSGQAALKAAIKHYRETKR
jgi:hypothetical protein